MAGTTVGNWWQYSRWINNIARNSRITNPSDDFLVAVRTFLWVIWSPATQTGTRPWLADKFTRLAVSPAGEYSGNLVREPAHVLAKMLTVVGRDLKKIPITEEERAFADDLINASENRHLGTGPYFGGVIGDGPVSTPV